MQKYLFLTSVLGFQRYRSQKVTSEQVKLHLNITGNFEDYLGQQEKNTSAFALPLCPVDGRCATKCPVRWVCQDVLSALGRQSQLHLLVQRGMGLSSCAKWCYWCFPCGTNDTALPEQRHLAMASCFWCLEMMIEIAFTWREGGKKGRKEGREGRQAERRGGRKDFMYLLLPHCSLISTIKLHVT